MSIGRLVLIIASYDTVDAARADFGNVRQLWEGTRFGDAYEAAVVSRNDDGSVEIIQRHNEPTIADAGAGLATGLAVGVVLALFPAVGLGAGLVAGGAGSAGLGALSGHLSGHLSRHDIKELSEVLDQGASGLLVATRNPTAPIDPALEHAVAVVRKDLAAKEESPPPE